MHDRYPLKPDQITDEKPLPSNNHLRRVGKKVMALATAAVAAAVFFGEANNDANAGRGLPNTNIHEASPKTTVTSVTTKDRVVYINEKPAFLFGVWAPKDDWSVDNLGTNVLISHWDTSPENFADSVAGRAWILRYSQPGDSLGKTLPNQIGVAWADEPDGYKIGPQELASTPQDGRLNFQNYLQHIADAGLNTNESARGLYQGYIKNLGRKAVIGFDYYIMNWDSCKFPTTGPGDIYHYTLGTKWVSPKDTPIEVFIETVKLPGSCPVELTPKLVTGEAKAAITAGATWINWWERTGLNTPNATSPKVARAIKSFTEEVHSLSPILLAPQMNEKKIKFLRVEWDDPLKLGGRVVTGKNGKVTNYVIAFNGSDKPLVMEKKLPGLSGGQKVTEAITGKTVVAKNGEVQYTLAAYDWGIFGYTLPLATDGNRQQGR